MLRRADGRTDLLIYAARPYRPGAGTAEMMTMASLTSGH
jgi:hypothetical protein